MFKYTMWFSSIYHYTEKDKLLVVILAEESFLSNYIFESNNFIFYFIIFIFSILGIMISNLDLIKFLICLELATLSSIMIFLIGSLDSDDLTGIIVTIFNLTVAGGESAIGLVLLINLFESKMDIKLLSLKLLKS